MFSYTIHICRHSRIERCTLFFVVRIDDHPMLRAIFEYIRHHIIWTNLIFLRKLRQLAVEAAWTNLKVPLASSTTLPKLLIAIKCSSNAASRHNAHYRCKICQFLLHQSLFAQVKPLKFFAWQSEVRTLDKKLNFWPGQLATSWDRHK